MTHALRGRVATPNGILADGVVTIGGGVITSVEPAGVDEALPQTSSLILPGLVDVHCHGGGGVSFPDATSESALTAAAFHRRFGVTSVMASLVSAPAEKLMAQTVMLADLAERGEIAGIHLEGPFLAILRCGAQDPESIIDGDPQLLGRILDAGRGYVRSMTLAPETAHYDELVALMRGAGVVPSIGHTDADAATVARAIDGLDGGPVSATHLFNGMPPFHHRAPGPVAACLAAAGRGRMVLELIGDGTHLDDQTVRTVFDLVGPGQICFVSDSMAAAGMADGRYRLGALDVEVTGGVARLADGSGAIAGGTSNVFEIVRRAVDAGVALSDALTAASTTPARLMGLTDVGSIEVGKAADLIVANPSLDIIGVMHRGHYEGAQ